MRISARNCLEGKIVATKEGPVTTEVTIETAAGHWIGKRKQKEIDARHAQKSEG